ncbi:MAG: MBL fold metallo-hydrolase [Armatimonadetes bacterium]|nr:MBL fold metallo-hydrolase [Armatimonadota bacterium]
MPQLQPLLPNLWLYPDTCNVYVLQDANRALLVDFGSGEVLRHLPEIGVNQVEWVLYTHHHREQCQGHPRLSDLNVRVGVPAQEADLFTDPAGYFRQFKRCAVEGAPYARPPRDPITVHARFQDGDDFTWGPYRIACDHAPGHSPGMMVYRTRVDGKPVAFSGDLLRDEGQLDTFYDSEWDYGFGAGMTALLRSLRILRMHNPEILLPSHGAAPLRNAHRHLDRMIQRLDTFLPLYLRDWDMDENLFLSRRASLPTEVNGVRRISPHLFSLVGNTLGHNCYILLSDSGRGLMIDAGIFLADAARWLDEKLEQMEAAFGLKGIDAVLVSHYHGDHLLQVPHMVEKHGAEVWTHEAVVEPLRSPDRRNLTCLHPNYGIPADAIPVHRTLKEGETLEWEGFRLKALHLPGQTEFAAGYFGEIDGKAVGFTGDNMFASPNRSGHDAFIARNRGILEQGYLKCAEALREQDPDLLLGGHAQEIPSPRKQIEHLRDWALKFRDVLTDLSPYPEYEYLIDPYWVEIMPYKLHVSPGQTASAILSLTNHREEETAIQAAIRVPPGWTADPPFVRVQIPPRTRHEANLILRCPSDTRPDIYPLTIDITMNGEKLGEKFDSRLVVSDAAKDGADKRDG